jgi:hypothetical protein
LFSVKHIYILWITTVVIMPYPTIEPTLAEELANNRIRGGAEVNPYELSNRQAVR